jgi:hypothetical protein
VSGEVGLLNRILINSSKVFLDSPALATSCQQRGIILATTQTRGATRAINPESQRFDLYMFGPSNFTFRTRPFEPRGRTSARGGEASRDEAPC